MRIGYSAMVIRQYPIFGINSCQSLVKIYQNAGIKKTQTNQIAELQWFKTMSTNDYIRNVKTNDWPPFKKRLWQRSFHDHIIRNERSLNAIRKYIANNPINWEQDIDNLINL